MVYNLESFGYVPGNGTAGSYDSSIFSVLRSLHTDFRNGHTHTPTPTSSQALAVHCSWWWPFWLGWNGNLKGACIFSSVSMLNKDIEHFSKWFSALCNASFETCLLSSLVYLLTGLFGGLGTCFSDSLYPNANPCLVCSQQRLHFVHLLYFQLFKSLVPLLACANNQTLPQRKNLAIYKVLQENNDTSLLHQFYTRIWYNVHLCVCVYLCVYQFVNSPK